MVEKPDTCSLGDAREKVEPRPVSSAHVTAAAPWYKRNIVSRSTPALQVVAVPDFSSPERARVFEARTLLFLGSWLERAGQARSFPLRLACIGSVPSSVQRLAEHCGATVEVYPPLGLTGSLTANKLRGLEVAGQPGQLLMLDTDVFILGDFSPLAAEIPAGLAAAPAGSKWVPEALWQRIYQHLDLPTPEERTAMPRVEYGLLPASRTLHEEFGQTTDLARMLPYYNLRSIPRTA